MFTDTKTNGGGLTSEQIEILGGIDVPGIECWCIGYRQTGGNPQSFSYYSLVGLLDGLKRVARTLGDRKYDYVNIFWYVPSFSLEGQTMTFGWAWNSLPIEDNKAHIEAIMEALAPIIESSIYSVAWPKDTFKKTLGIWFYPRISYEFTEKKKKNSGD